MSHWCYSCGSYVPCGVEHECDNLAILKERLAEAESDRDAFDDERIRLAIDNNALCAKLALATEALEDIASCTVEGSTTIEPAVYCAQQALAKLREGAR